MALKSSYTSEEKGAEIEEALDALDALIDRVKVLYEQYFMGIQKQPPTHLHTTVERELRELQQQQIRNTALRYRLATLQQKHGAYNTYWKRTLREIESGRYLRNLSRLRARAAKTGEEIPEEILAKMPKRMRDAIAKDRELALAKAERDHQLPEEVKVAVAIEQSTEERKRLRRESSPAMVVSAVPILDDAHGGHGAHGHPGHPAHPGHGSHPGLHVPGGIAPVSSQALPAAAKPSRGERLMLDDILGDDDIDAALAQLADEAATEIERRRPTQPPPVARPAEPARAPTPPPSRAAEPARVVPPIKIVPPGLRGATPPAGVPIRAATPPAGVPVPPGSRTPPTGLPAIPPPGSHASAPASQPVTPAASTTLGGIHPLPPISNVQPAVTLAAAQAAQVEAAAAPAPPSTPPVAPMPDAAPAVPEPAASRASSPSRAWPAASSGVRPAVSRPSLSRPAATADAPSSIPGMSEQDTRVLYAKYVKARTLVGDRTEPMSYERMVKTLSSQAPKIIREHHSTGVEFNVVVRDNKVILKAKPK